MIDLTIVRTKNDLVILTSDRNAPAQNECTGLWTQETTVYGCLAQTDGVLLSCCISKAQLASLIRNFPYVPINPNNPDWKPEPWIQEVLNERKKERRNREAFLTEAYLKDNAILEEKPQKERIPKIMGVEFPGLGDVYYDKNHLTRTIRVKARFFDPVKEQAAIAKLKELGFEVTYRDGTYSKNEYIVFRVPFGTKDLTNLPKLKEDHLGLVYTSNQDSTGVRFYTAKGCLNFPNSTRKSKLEGVKRVKQGLVSHTVCFTDPKPKTKIEKESIRQEIESHELRCGIVCNAFVTFFSALPTKAPKK